MLDEYLLDVPEFADLDFYSLDWENSGYVENVKIQRKLIRSISGECLKIIDRYKKEKANKHYLKLTSHERRELKRE